MNCEAQVATKTLGLFYCTAKAKNVTFKACLRCRGETFDFAKCETCTKMDCPNRLCPHCGEAGEIIPRRPCPLG